MKRERFEAEVIALATDGVALTAANASARTGVSPRRAEEMLDQMLRDGHLDSDVDETEGVVVYRVRGLTAAGVRKRVHVGDDRGRIDGALQSAATTIVVREVSSRAKEAFQSRRPGKSPGMNPGQKSLLWGGALGLLGPIGLAYAAPWATVFLYTAGWMVLWAIPIVRSIFAYFSPLLHLTTAVLGLLYTIAYNKTGERRPILPKN